MPTPLHAVIAAAAASLFLVACSANLTKPEGAQDARDKLARLQADPALADRAPIATKEAEAAVMAAEVPQKPGAEARHLVVMADRKVDIAMAKAQARQLEDQRKALIEAQQTAQLDSRTREANNARSDASMARTDAKLARSDADMARSQAEMARVDTDEARKQSALLQQRIDGMNAKATDRGLVVTLGDVLFATGKADLKGGVTSNLGKLATFLGEYPDRTVQIKGHTDSIGGADYNHGLSERRAESVKAYLVGQGIVGTRISASGMGEDSPVSGNDTATGRQQNRRVEVIISNPMSASQ